MIKDIYRKLLQELANGNPAVVVTKLEMEGAQQKIDKIIISETSRMDQQATDMSMHTIVEEIMENGKIRWVQQSASNGTDKGAGTGYNGQLFEPFYAPPRLIVLGGGHIAVPLVEFASRCGFEITVVDDRPSFANPERFPAAKEVICDSFENCFAKLKLNRSCYVVVVTRGHRHDMVCLTNVLRQDTAYAGMIGSKRRVAIVKENLLENGVDQQRLSRLCAPIGLPIGAITPEEIAVSILGQVIAARRLGRTLLDETAKTAKGKSLEFDAEVMEALAEQDNETAALVTIIDTKGSSPRHAGAKMLVYPDGRILGSIGGGCCESEVILIARDLMRAGGGCRIHKVDMTDDAAEEEGMVCGGTMTVLIEA